MGLPLLAPDYPGQVVFMKGIKTENAAGIIRSPAALTFCLKKTFLWCKPIRRGVLRSSF
jgi:hypothetical protein